MPCNDSRDFDNVSVTREYFNDLVKSKESESGLCSVVNFLKLKGLFDEACNFAEVNSKFKLKDWAEKHKEEDKKRVFNILKLHLSEDEIDLIIEMVENKDLIK